MLFSKCHISPAKPANNYSPSIGKCNIEENKTGNANLFKFLDEMSSFNSTFHIEADVHFDLSDGVSQLYNRNLETYKHRSVKRGPTCSHRKP